MSYNQSLSMNELGRILNYDNEKTNVARDILLFSCFTGLKFSDIQLIQVGDFYEDEEGVRWLGLHSELPLHFSKILVTPALAKIVDRNVGCKSKEDMLFTFPHVLTMQMRLDTIAIVCDIQCKITSSTGQSTCEFNFEHLSNRNFTL